MPKNSTRSATGVVVSRSPITLPAASNFMMPPSSVAVSSPPNSLPVMLTAIERISMIGNLPSASRNGSILRPSIAPEKLSPPTDGRPSIETDSEIRKRSDAVSKFGHSIPIALIRIGSHSGHLKLPPVGAADREEHAEARQGVERAVTEDREVARLAAELEAADRDLGADLDELDQLLGARRPGVEAEPDGGDLDEAVDPEARACRPRTRSP